MVLVKSGDYFIGYVGLDKPQIKKGDIIAKNQALGILAKQEQSYLLNLLLMERGQTVNINRWFDWKAAHNISLLQ